MTGTPAASASKAARPKLSVSEGSKKEITDEQRFNGIFDFSNANDVIGCDAFFHCAIFSMRERSGPSPTKQQLGFRINLADSFEGLQAHHGRV